MMCRSNSTLFTIKKQELGYSSFKIINFRITEPLNLRKKNKNKGK